MAESLGTAVLELRTDSTQFGGGLQQAKQSAERSFTDIAAKAVAVYAALKTIGSVVGDLVGSFQEQERATAKLASVLESTGNVVGYTVGELAGMASELQRVTVFGDETVISAQAVLATFTRIGHDVFPQAIEAAADMSTVMGQDLQSSIVQIGKALNDPIAGVTALRRVGVQLTEQQQAQVKSFMDLGDVASAQAIILAELQTEFGGAARAMGETTYGASIKLQNAFGDLKEEIGAVLSTLQAEAAPQIIGVFQNITRWLHENGPNIFAFISRAPDIAAAAFRTVAAIARKSLSWDTLKEVLVALGAGILRTLQNAFRFVVEYAVARFKILIAPVELLGEVIWSVLKNAFANVVNFFAKIFHDAISGVANLINDILLGGVNKILDVLKVAHIKLIEIGEFRAPLSVEPIEKWSDAWERMLGRIGGGVSDAIGAFKRLAVEQGAILAEVGANLGEIFGPEIAAFIAEYNRLIQEGAKAFEGFQVAGQGAARAASDLGDEVVESTDVIARTLRIGSDEWRAAVGGLQDTFDELAYGVTESTATITETLRTGTDAWRAMVGGVTDEYERMAQQTGLLGDEMAAKTTETWDKIANDTIGAVSTMTGSMADVLKAFFDWKLSQEGLTAEESQKIMREQAIAQKAFALVSIAINTASAIVQALATLGPIAGPIMAVVIGALGAAQAALVLATPIPTAVTVPKPTVPSFEAPSTGNVLAGPGRTREGGGAGAGATFEQQRPITVTVDVHDNNVFGGSLRDFALILRTELESIDELGL